MADLQITDETVDAFNRAHGEVWRARAPITQGEATSVAREATHAGLAAALVASGWRREADVRAEVAADLTRFADRARDRAYRYAAELPICARVSNDCVVNAYYKAASLARSGDDRNPHCANCGDLRGGPRGHETSECQWQPCNSAEHKRATALNADAALPVAASSGPEPVEPCGAKYGVTEPRVCVMPKGHGGTWHDDGRACWPAVSDNSEKGAGDG